MHALHVREDGYLLPHDRSVILPYSLQCHWQLTRSVKPPPITKSSTSISPDQVPSRKQKRKHSNWFCLEDLLWTFPLFWNGCSRTPLIWTSKASVAPVFDLLPALMDKSMYLQTQHRPIGIHLYPKMKLTCSDYWQVSSPNVVKPPHPTIWIITIPSIR